MKKIIAAVLLSCIFLFVFAGCADKTEDFTPGVYVIKDEQKVTGNSSKAQAGDIYFGEDGEFRPYITSSLSSVSPYGTYERSGNKIIGTVAEKYKYVFKIDNGTLKYVESESDPIPESLFAYVFADGEELVRKSS